MRNHAMALLVLPILSACSAFGAKPVIEDRYRTVSWVEEGEASPKILISASTLAPPSESAKVPITALSDHGQAALITATSGKPPAALEGGSKGPARLTFEDTIKRRIVLALRPERFLPPGDRLVSARIRIEADPGSGRPWRFAGWDRVENKEETIDVGTLKVSDNASLTAETGLGIGGPLSDTKIGFERGRTVAQEAVVRDTTIISAAIDEAGRAWIDQRAGWRKDLIGNATIDASFRVPRSRVRGAVFTAASPLMRDAKVEGGKTTKGGPMPAAEVVLSAIDVYSPDNPLDPICARAAVDYVIRHVEGGAASYTESDDDVQLRSGQSATIFVLAPPPLIPAYGLRTAQFELAYAPPGSDPRLPDGLRFRSMEEAIGFLEWLRVTRPKGGAVGKGKVGLIDPAGSPMRPMSAAELAGLRAELLNADQVEQAEARLNAGCPAGTPR